MNKLFFCNGNDPKCKKTICYKNGGDCYRTIHENCRLKLFINDCEIPTYFNRFDSITYEDIDTDALFKRLGSDEV